MMNEKRQYKSILLLLIFTLVTFAPLTKSFCKAMSDCNGCCDVEQSTEQLPYAVIDLDLSSCCESSPTIENCQQFTINEKIVVNDLRNQINNFNALSASRMINNKDEIVSTNVQHPKIFLLATSIKIYSQISSYRI